MTSTYLTTESTGEDARAVRTRIAKPQLPALTGVRFFLALWVVIFHQSKADGSLMGHFLPFAPPVLIGLIRTGYLAVGVFFALSGFVLAYNYQLENRWSYRKAIDFAVARFARIYPAYALGLLLMAPMILLNLRKAPAKPWWKQAGEAALSWTLLQAWTPTHAFAWNMPGWSLSAEAFFYVLFPIVGVALWRISSRPNRIWPLLAGCWLAALTPAVAGIVKGVAGFSNVPAISDNLLGDPFWVNFFKLNPVFQLPQFCFGILLVRLYQDLQSRAVSPKPRGTLLYISGFCLAGLLIANANWIAFPLFHNGLLLPAHGFIIVGLAMGGGALCTFLSGTTLRLLGNASYAMYILHWPIFEWMNWLSIRRTNRPLDGFGALVLYLAVVVVLSILVYRWVEEPMNSLIKSRWRARRP